eukprot:SAG22_NODE_82_length_21749_cov_10.719769_11_plen_446_part_00
MGNLRRRLHTQDKGGSGTFPEVVARLEGVDQEAVLAAGVAVTDRIACDRVVQLQLVRHAPGNEPVAGEAAAILLHPFEHQPRHAQRDTEGNGRDVQACDHLERGVLLRRALDAVVLHQDAEFSADFSAIEHPERLVADARIAQEDDHKSIRLELSGRRRMPGLPPRIDVLQRDEPEHCRRDDKHANDPCRVKVKHAGRQAVELQDRLQIDHERLERFEHGSDIARKLQVQHWPDLRHDLDVAHENTDGLVHDAKQRVQVGRPLRDGGRLGGGSSGAGGPEASRRACLQGVCVQRLRQLTAAACCSRSAAAAAASSAPHVQETTQCAQRSKQPACCVRIRVCRRALHTVITVQPVARLADRTKQPCMPGLAPLSLSCLHARSLERAFEDQPRLLCLRDRVLGPNGKPGRAARDALELAARHTGRRRRLVFTSQSLRDAPDLTASRF